MTGWAYPLTMALTIGLSLGGHAALFRGLADSAHEAPKRQRRVEVAVMERKPQPTKPPPRARPKRPRPPPKEVTAMPETPPPPSHGS